MSTPTRRAEIAKYRATLARLDADGSKELRRVCTYALRYIDMLAALDEQAARLSPMQRGAIRAELYALWDVRKHKEARERTDAAERQLSTLLRALVLSPTLVRCVQRWPLPADSPGDERPRPMSDADAEALELAL